MTNKPEELLDEKTMLRFMDKIEIVPESGCWIWMGADNGTGYGQHSFNGKHQYVHRISYELYVGPIPDGLQIDHLCRVRCCANPAHLEPVTQQENLLRGETINARNIAKTHCPKGHPYSGGNLYVDKKGKRYCRSCWRMLNLKRQGERTDD